MFQPANGANFAPARSCIALRGNCLRDSFSLIGTLSVRQHEPAAANGRMRPSVGSLRDSHSRNPVGNTYTFGAGR
ncbi:MAG: hypothetical protein Kow0026_21370 [Oricola sp.]